MSEKEDKPINFFDLPVSPKIEIMVLTSFLEAEVATTEKQRGEISYLQEENSKLKEERDENYRLAKWWTNAWNNLNMRYEHLKATGKEIPDLPVEGITDYK